MTSIGQLRDRLDAAEGLLAEAAEWIGHAHRGGCLTNTGIPGHRCDCGRDPLHRRLREHADNDRKDNDDG